MKGTAHPIVTDKNEAPLCETEQASNPELIEGFTHELGRALDAAMAPLTSKRLKKFIERHGTKKWIIASDYCISDPDRPLDSMVFSIFPAGIHFDSTMRRLDEIPKRDLKSVRTIPPIVLKTLRNGSVFTLAFAADPHRRLFTSPGDLRSALDEAIAMMERWNNAEACKTTISQFKLMRTELSKNSININLVTNITLVTAITAHIASFIANLCNAEFIGWASDRDNIINSFNGIAKHMLSVNLAAICARMNNEMPKLGFFEQTNDNLWCDRFTRLPDYIAGTIASWDPPVSVKVKRKINQIIEGSIADNRYLFLFRIAFMVANNVRKIEVSRALVSRNPIHTERNRPKARNVSALRGRSKFFTE